MELWPCGHPKTPENAATQGAVRGKCCRECRNARCRKYSKSAKGRRNRRRWDIEYQSSEKRRANVQFHNRRRLFRLEGAGRARTPEQAAIINQHIKQRLAAFRAQQKDTL